jgi:hypothetical protein
MGAAAAGAVHLQAAPADVDVLGRLLAAAVQREAGHREVAEAARSVSTMLMADLTDTRAQLLAVSDAAHHASLETARREVGLREVTEATRTACNGLMDELADANRNLDVLRGALAQAMAHEYHGNQPFGLNFSTVCP